MSAQFLLERIMGIGFRVGFGVLAEKCKGVTRNNDQHLQEQQLNRDREVRVLKEQLCAKEAEIERLNTSLSVAVISVVIISCLFLGSNMSSEQNTS